MLCGQENGQVGIGITDPANLPDASYLLAVDGKVACEEVLVELSFSWPDYVFEDDYPLIPLNQLNEEIKNLGHLPNMPSAAEIENSGLSLGEMQVKLLEKIEELTLYIIDLDTQNRQLQSRVDHLIKVIEKQ